MSDIVSFFHSVLYAAFGDKKQLFLEAVRRYLLMTSAIAGHLRDRIKRDIAANVLPCSADATALAGLVIAVVQGMSVLARDGAMRASLIDVANVALAGWPDRT